MTSPGRRSALLCVLCIAACAHLFRPGPTPAALAGAWVDVEQTTREDSSIVVLSPSGNAVWLRIRRGYSQSRHHLGMWYLSGDIADTARRALCFNRRPGRDGPSCMRFSLDTASSGPRLTLFGYSAAPDTGHPTVLTRR